MKTVDELIEYRLPSSDPKGWTRMTYHELEGLIEATRSDAQADNTQLRKEVERLDKELHDQIQYKLEACRMAEEFKSENARLSQRNGVLESAQTACLGERDTAIGERDALMARYREAVELLSSARDTINEVSTYGSCQCDIPNGDICITCECENKVKSIDTLLATVKGGSL